MSPQAWSSFALLLAVASASPSLMASPAFPYTIQNHLALSYLPPCTLCHATVQGGGPVVTAFGQGLVARGLSSGNEAALRAALDQLASGNVDTDADGRSDVEELVMATDPSSAEPSSLSDVPALQHGCVSQIAPRGDLGWPALAALVTLLVLAGRSAARPGRRRARPKTACSPADDGTSSIERTPR